MKHTEESKKKMSENKKKWLTDNPDKHPWKKSTKFISVPCETLKSHIKELNIPFIEEFSPVNGNPHYERNGQLKPYYQKRSDIIENSGWKLYQVHYSCCFNKEMIGCIIQEILESDIKLEFNYLTYTPKSKIEYFCKICNKLLSKGNISGFCKGCVNKTYPKKDKLIRQPRTTKKVIELPCSNCGKVTENSRFCSYDCNFAFKNKNSKRLPKEVLEKLVWEKPTMQIAKELGVSDSAIGKWCKSFGISKPPRGYWEKLHHKKD